MCNKQRQFGLSKKQMSKIRSCLILEIRDEIFGEVEYVERLPKFAGRFTEYFIFLATERVAKELIFFYINWWA